LRQIIVVARLKRRTMLSVLMLHQNCLVARYKRRTF